MTDTEAEARKVLIVETERRAREAGVLSAVQGDYKNRPVFLGRIYDDWVDAWNAAIDYRNARLA